MGGTASGAVFSPNKNSLPSSLDRQRDLPEMSAGKTKGTLSQVMVICKGLKDFRLRFLVLIWLH